MRHINEIIWNITTFAKIGSCCSDRRATCLKDKTENGDPVGPAHGKDHQNAKWMVSDQQFDTHSIGKRRRKPTLRGSLSVRGAIGGFVNERNQAEKPAGAGYNPR
ncbi:MAG: hypothetical protein ACOYLK_15320 [Sphingomonas sp.]